MDAPHKEFGMRKVSERMCTCKMSFGSCTISFRSTQTNKDGRERLPFLHANERQRQIMSLHDA